MNGTERDRIALEHKIGQAEIMPDGDDFLVLSSDGTKVYAVQWTGYIWQCECTAATFGLDCWHLLAVKQRIAAASPAEPVKVPCRQCGKMTHRNKMDAGLCARCLLN